MDPFVIDPSQYAPASSYIGANIISAAMPATESEGLRPNPLNTLGEPAPSTLIVTSLAAAQTNAFGHPFDSQYSVDDKNAPVDPDKFMNLSDTTLAEIDAAGPTKNATDSTGSANSTFVTIPSEEDDYALIANVDTGNVEIGSIVDGTRFIAESGHVSLVSFLLRSLAELHLFHHPCGCFSLRYKGSMLTFLRLLARALASFTTTQMRWRNMASRAFASQTYHTSQRQLAPSP